MASSGSVVINAKSVDNGNNNSCVLTSGTCYTDSNASYFGRGAAQADITLNWSVNDSGLFTVSYGGTSYPGAAWFVCSSNGYHIDIDFSTDGVNWTTIMSGFRNDWGCPSDNYVADIASSVASTISPSAVTLTQSGYIRARMWTPNACPTCGVGTASRPNAFPNDAASTATAVPVHIDVSWTATLNYNANGGTGAPSAQTHLQTANSYAFTISNTTPTRQNYRFEGWSTNSSATSAQYQPGDTFTVYKNDPTVTLYAVWKKFYHPGAVLNGSSQWMSHDRSSGACQVLSDAANNTWKDMRTIDAPTGLGDPPAIYHDAKYFNQLKIGKE